MLRYLPFLLNGRVLLNDSIHKEDLMSDQDVALLEEEGDHVASSVAPSYRFFINVLPRLNTRERWVERLILACCARRGKTPGCLDALSAHPAAYLDDTAPVRRVQSFFNGSALFMRILWPITYFSLVVIDFSNLMNMPYPFDSSWWQILLGLSNNEDPASASLTSSLGSRRPDTWGFWAIRAVLYSSPVLFGLVNLVRNCRRPSDNAELSSRSTSVSDTTTTSDIKIGYDGQEKAFHIDGQYFHQFAYLFERQKLGSRKRADMLNDIERSGGHPSCLHRAILSCLCWSMGVNDFIIHHVLFYLFVAIPGWLPTINYFRMIVTDILLWKSYYEQKVLCGNQNRELVWSNEVGEYRCDACVFPFVDYASRQTIEGCLERLFSYNRTATTLTASLVAVSNQLAAIRSVDLSQQDIFSFSLDDLECLLSTLSSDLPNIQFLNLSALPVIQVLTDQSLDMLVEYLSALPNLEVLDLSGLVILNQSNLVLLEYLTNASIREFYWSQAGLGFDSWVAYVNATAKSVRKLVLQSSSLLPPDNEALVLKPLVNGSSIDLRHSLINQKMLNSLVNWFSMSSLLRLDISGLDLGVLNASLLWPAVRMASNLSLSSCNLGDDDLGEMAVGLTGGQVVDLDLSRNRFGYLGVSYLENITKSLQGLDIGNNNLADAIYYLNLWLRNSTIEYLSISGIYLNEHDQRILLGAVLNSTVNRLVCSNMCLSDSVWVEFVDQLVASEKQMISLDLSGNPITNMGVSTVFDAADELGLQELYLSEVDLSESIANSSWYALLSQNSSLDILDISGSNLGDDNLDYLGSSLRNSQLTGLEIADNKFSANGLHGFIKNMRYEPSFLEKIEPEDNVDYRHYLYEYTHQDNSLQYWALQGVNLSVSNLHEICLELLNFGLNISGVGFDPHQLFMSSQVGVAGCPAAIANGAAQAVLSPFLVFGLLLLILLSSIERVFGFNHNPVPFKQHELSICTRQASAAEGSRHAPTTARS